MIKGFNAIISKEPIIMILGSAPSVISLKESQYYGNPNNSFWNIISKIYNHDKFKNYEEKKSFILNQNIILWDVVNTCNREGSLDSQIKDVEPNTIPELLKNNNTIKVVFFNGQKAQKLYKKHINYYPTEVKFVQLPSTSPAYTLKVDKKLEIWKNAFKKYI